MAVKPTRRGSPLPKPTVPRVVGRQGSPGENTKTYKQLPTQKLAAKAKKANPTGTRKGSPGGPALMNRDMRKAHAEAKKYGSTR